MNFLDGKISSMPFVRIPAASIGEKALGGMRPTRNAGIKQVESKSVPPSSGANWARSVRPRLEKRWSEVLAFLKLQRRSASGQRR